ncbi:MAG: hypothetical protein ABI548_22415 [Polyangiaceae bacterium]
MTDKQGNDIDLNLWVARKRWAFPTFYASMTEDEIVRLRTAAETAQKRKLGIWKGYHAKLSFDRALLFKDTPKDTADAGAVSTPKVFRRFGTELGIEWEYEVTRLDFATGKERSTAATRIPLPVSKSRGTPSRICLPVRLLGCRST